MPPAAPGRSGVRPPAQHPPMLKHTPDGPDGMASVKDRGGIVGQIANGYSQRRPRGRRASMPSQPSVVTCQSCSCNRPSSM